MDSYTRSTQAWLDQRYDKLDPAGHYIAHQPIYGFRGGPSEPNVLSRYARFYGILRTINRCRFDSFLDVGGSEGYCAAFIKRFFRTQHVVSSDLSKQACQRARTIYGLETKVADIHDLPFNDKSFDLVLCSETIEHVSDPKRALYELKRVAGRYLIVTTPNEKTASHLSRINNLSKIPHGHINQFNARELIRLLGDSTTIDYLRFRPLIPWLVFAEGPDLPDTVVSRYPKWLVGVYYRLRWLSRYTNLNHIKVLIKLDQKLSKRYPQQTADLLACCRFANVDFTEPFQPEADLLDELLYQHTVPLS